jgi:hypothetical protein
MLRTSLCLLALVSIGLPAMADEEAELEVDIELLEFLGSFEAGDEEQWVDPFWLDDAVPMETGGFDD